MKAGNSHRDGGEMREKGQAPKAVLLNMVLT